MEYAKAKFQSEEYAALADGFLYTDIPLLHKPAISIESKSDMIPGKKNIVYTGSLSEHIRNPQAVLMLFSGLERSDFVLHFYSKGCEKQLSAAKQILQDRLILHGYVAPERAYAAVEHCDYLLNISNHTAYQVPSKIFEYFATGKPIINALSTHTDPAIPYYSRYESILNLFTCDDSNTSLAQLERFLFHEQHEHIPYVETEEIFHRNTSEYFVSTFIQRMNEVRP